MKTNKKGLKAIQIFVLIGSLCFMAKAQMDTIPYFNPEIQIDNKVCWAACCQMVLEYYGNKTIDQESDIISYGTPGIQDTGNYIYKPGSDGAWYSYDTSYTTTTVFVDTTICEDDFGDENYNQTYCEENPDECSCYGTTVSHNVVTRNITSQGPFHACNGILYHFSPYVASSWLNTYINSISLIDSQIKARKPIIAERSSSNSAYPNHVVVIVGDNSSDGTIKYFDPNNPTLAKQSLPYSQFVNSSPFTWDQTLEMTSQPPDGALDYVTISSGPTAFTYQSTYAQYKCQFWNPDNATANSFSWSLVFDYLGGSDTVVKGTATGTNMSSWIINSFALPPGHIWVRDNNGIIQGKVRVLTIDSDGFPHGDSKSITYTEQNPYPDNIFFDNQTISSSHADVKSHSLIQLDNDQVTSAGIINFKSGQVINIFPETKILSGSKVNIIIDPALQ
jgi:hypothetical protein